MIYSTPFLTFGVLFLSLPWANKANQKIVEWNKDNVITEGGFDPQVDLPRESNEVYTSFVYDTTNPVFGTSNTNGGIIWAESDVQAPGMKVVTDGDNDESCLMTAGDDPSPESDVLDKQCNDAFQTSKRFKRVARTAGEPIDLVFDVEPVDSSLPVDSVYRIFEKYENNLIPPRRIKSFKVELGVGIGSGFIPQSSTTSDSNLVFTTADGTKVLSESTTTSDKDLSAFFAFGLFGDADKNNNHLLDGYYDPKGRANFVLVASEDTILAESVTSNVENVYGGSWISKGQAPWAFFVDNDNSTDTDAITFADWNGKRWQTYRLCEDPTFKFVDELDPVVKDIKECREDPDGNPVGISDKTIAKWIASPLFTVGRIDDVGNVNLNYHIQVKDNFEELSFTLRITPTLDNGDASAPWLESLPWESDVQIKKLKIVNGKDNIKGGTTREIRIKVENNGPDEVVSGEIFVHVKNKDGYVGFRKTVAIDNLAKGRSKRVSIQWPVPADFDDQKWLKLVATVEAFAADKGSDRKVVKLKSARRGNRCAGKKGKKGSKKSSKKSRRHLRPRNSC